MHSLMNKKHIYFSYMFWPSQPPSGIPFITTRRPSRQLHISL